jgi:transposase
MPGKTKVVVGGVDTHKEIHVAAVIDATGKLLDTASFAATAAGYRTLLAWMRRFGQVAKVGVEGTGAYGSGLARYLRGQGVVVIEVDRPDRRARRRRGKSDTVDAEAAARAALSGEASVVPKAADGIVESIRALRVAFRSARDSRVRVTNQMRDLLITAPEPLRAQLSALESDELTRRAARFKVGPDLAEPLEATRLALRSLARRYIALSEEMAALEVTLDTLTARANPSLRGINGVGPDSAAILLVAAGDNPQRMHSEAAFAALCGVSPIEASTGKTTRHRLNRGGNRQANHALWRIVMVRLTFDRNTQAYRARRRAEGKSDREIIRCLKRHVAREVYRHLVAPCPVPSGPNLRLARVAAGLSLAQVAPKLGTSTMKMSRIERAIDYDNNLLMRYEALLARPPARRHSRHKTTIAA